MINTIQYFCSNLNPSSHQAGVAWMIAAMETLLVVLASTVYRDWLTCAKPDDEKCSEALEANFAAVCSLPTSSWHIQQQYSTASLATEFNLVCGRGWLLQLAAVCYFLGLLAGCVIWQVAGERHGRRRLLYVACMLCGIFGALAATAPSLWIYIIFRTVVGASVGGIGISAFVLATDIAGPTWRGYSGMLMQLFFSFGGLAGAVAATLISSWRWLTLIPSLAALLYMSTWRLMVESPSWLLLRGRKGEASGALAAIAFANQMRPPDRPLADPLAALGSPDRTLGDVIRNPRLR
jgi:MFS transporter, OCT family, solute carrier family 22 (organic cation transporter), member 4/5